MSEGAKSHENSAMIWRLEKAHPEDSRLRSPLRWREEYRLGAAKRILVRESIRSLVALRRVRLLDASAKAVRPHLERNQFPLSVFVSLTF